MLTNICPKLPMRDLEVTKQFYINQLGFKNISAEDYDAYLILQKDNIEIHFFEFKTLDPTTNYGQVYIRTQNIEQLYQSFLENHVKIHPNGHLKTKSWGQNEFSLLDPDHNLLTFGENI